MKPDLMNGMLRWRNKWVRVMQPNQKNIGLFLKLVDLLFQRAISLSYSWEFIEKEDKMSYSRKLLVAND